jgi:hypothetical protein
MTPQERYKTFFPGIMYGATTIKGYNWPSSGNTGYDGAMVPVWIVHLFMKLYIFCWKNTI